MNFHWNHVPCTGKAGVKTLLLEKKKFPRDKYCGDAVCKTAIEILDEMGIYEKLLEENKAKIVSLFATFEIVLFIACKIVSFIHYT